MFEDWLWRAANTGIDLEGVNPAAASNQMGEDRGVVAAACSHLNHGLAFAEAESAKPPRMSARLADIDSARRIQRNERILVDEGEVVVGSFDIAEPRKIDPPGARAREGLPRGDAERFLYPGIARPSPCRDITREKSS